MELSILIADDNELNRWLLAEQLKGLQAEVTMAGNGEQAWQCLRRQAFDLALLDVNMPRISGMELMAKIRGDASLARLYCVAVTAHAQPGRRQQLLQAGFDECLIKPISLADLQRVMPRQLSSPMQASHYANLLLQRVEDNRELAQLLLKKLFEQVPGQFTSLQLCLQNQRYQDAWEVAHQLHGTFCFYGFEDFRAQALALEQSLVNAVDAADAQRLLQMLQDEFAALADRQARLLDLVT